MSSINYYELTNPQKRIWFTEVMHNHLEMSNIGYLIQLRDNMTWVAGQGRQIRGKSQRQLIAAV